MSEIISWKISGYDVRKAVASLCGWETRKGKLTVLGNYIAKTEWENLSPAARNVLIQHGIIA